jgi:hypothetical protein
MGQYTECLQVTNPVLKKWEVTHPKDLTVLCAGDVLETCYTIPEVMKTWKPWTILETRVDENEGTD